jgi:hypothetical protein
MLRRRNCTEPPPARPTTGSGDPLAEARQLRRARERRADLWALLGWVALVAAVWAALPPPG